jgi:hypothetical protein
MKSIFLKQNLGIVPSQGVAAAPHKTRTDLNVDVVTPRGAGINLVQQFGNLRRTRKHPVG